MPPSSANAYASLTAFKPRSSADVQAEADKKYGISESQTRLSSLRGLVGNLQSSVEAVDPSVTGRTSGTFTTEGQRQALVSKERAPILGSLAKEQGALGDEQSNFNTSQGLASQMAAALMNDDRTSYQKLLDQYNAAIAAEKEAEQRRQWQVAQDEQKRQFDAQLSESRRASGASGPGGYDMSSIANLLQPDKKYIGNDDFRGRLAFEAKNGNADAAIALKYAGNTGRYDGFVANKAEYEALRSIGIIGNYSPGGARVGSFGGTKSGGW